MNDKIKEILLKQVELLQEACERDMLPEDAARLSEEISVAVRMAAAVTPLERLNR